MPCYDGPPEPGSSAAKKAAAQLRKARHCVEHYYAEAGLKPPRIDAQDIDDAWARPDLGYVPEGKGRLLLDRHLEVLKRAASHTRCDDVRFVDLYDGLGSTRPGIDMPAGLWAVIRNIAALLRTFDDSEGKKVGAVDNDQIVAHWGGWGPPTHSNFDRTRELIAELPDLSDVHAGVDWMVASHVGTFRPGGEPYLEHTASVAVRTMALSDDPDLIIAALLHDSIEDSVGVVWELGYLGEWDRPAKKPTRKKELELGALQGVKRRFGESVVERLKRLTNPDFSEMVKQEKGTALFSDEADEALISKYTEHVVEIFEGEEGAAAIKLADFCDNALNLESAPASKRAWLIRKYRPSLRFLRQFLAQLPRGHLLAPAAAQYGAQIEASWTRHYR